MDFERWAREREPLIQTALYLLGIRLGMTDLQLMGFLAEHPKTAEYKAERDERERKQAESWGKLPAVRGA